MVQMWFPTAKINETTFFIQEKEEEVSQINASCNTVHGLLGKWFFWAILLSSTDIQKNPSIITVSLTETGPGFLSLFQNSSFTEIPHVTQVSQTTPRQNFKYTSLSGASCWEL